MLFAQEGFECILASKTQWNLFPSPMKPEIALKLLELE